MASSPVDNIRAAVVAVASGDFAAAGVACDAALQEASDPAVRGEILLLRAVAFRGGGDRDAAAAVLAAALEAWRAGGSGPLVAHLVSLSRALLGAGETDAAVRYLKVAADVATAHDRPTGFELQIGLVAAACGDHELARRIWTMALRSSDGPLARLNLARLELDRGFVGAALDHLELAWRNGVKGAAREQATRLSRDVCAALAEAGDGSGVTAAVVRLDLAAPPGVDRRAWRRIAAALDYDRGIRAISAGDMTSAADHLGAAAAADPDGELGIAIMVALAVVDARCGRTATALARASEAARRSDDEDQKLAAAAALVDVGEAASGHSEWAIVIAAYGAAADTYASAGNAELARAFSAAAAAARGRI